MKKTKIFLAVLVVALIAGMAWAATLTYFPQGIATARIHKSTYGYTSGASSYYLALPTLSANDTIVGLATTQTLTNKTLTAPTITAPGITGTSTIGTGCTLTSPTINGPTITAPAITGTSTIGAGMTMTSPQINGGTITGANLVGSGSASIGGFLMTVSPKAAGYSMTAADSGKVFYMSAGGELDLPDAVVGTVFNIVVVAGATVIVNPLGSDTILGLTNAAGDSITNTGGGTITLVCPLADKWYCLGTAYGTWTDTD